MGERWKRGREKRAEGGRETERERVEQTERGLRGKRGRRGREEEREREKEHKRIGKVSVQTNGGCLVVTEVVWHDDSQYTSLLREMLSEGWVGWSVGVDGR